MSGEGFPRPETASASFSADGRDAGGGDPGGGPARALTQGEILDGRYRIERFLARGGMGEVYEAQDLELRVRIALKTIRPRASASAQARERLKQEVLLARSVASPHVCRVFDLGRHQDSGRDVTFLTMELLLGETLAERIRKRGRFRPDEALRLAHDLASALGAAHKVGVVHRDFKSGNVMLVPTEDGERAVITDFGLAGVAEAEARPGLGTPHYASPEQVRGEHAGPRADIYALGVVLYEMVTGSLPFSGETAQDVLLRRLESDAPSPRALVQGLDARWEEGIARCLRRDPDERFESAEEAVASISGEVLPALEKARTKRRLRLALMAALLLILAAGTSLAAYRRQANRGWAREQLVEAETLAHADRYFEAHARVEEASRYLPADDPALVRLLPVVTDDLTVLSEPPGAAVYLRRFQRDAEGAFPPRERVGETPIRNLAVPRGEYVIALEQEGYAPFERTISSQNARVISAVVTPGGHGERREFAVVRTGAGHSRVWIDASAPIRLEVKLLPRGGVPARMVFVPGGDYSLVGFGPPSTAPVRLDDYFVDRFEVTNREFQEFVDRGGYARRDLWPPSLADAATSRLVDRTGRPGPRTWSNARFPEGRAEHPVSDVTWHEAAAYCAFRGKDLPTAYQWERAARDGSSAITTFVMPWGLGAEDERIADRANFGGAGSEPVGRYEFGMSPFGAHDMAGNVAEWLRNPGVTGFLVAGGAFSDPVYEFGGFGDYPGVYDSAAIGLRCVQLARPGSGDPGTLPLAQVEPARPRFTPVDDAAFALLLAHYRYDPTPLDPEVVDVLETDDWRREKVTFFSTGNERIPAYLWLPRHFEGPLQAVEYLPCGAASNGNVTLPEEVEILVGWLIRSGRAVLAVGTAGTRDRPHPRDWSWPDPGTVRHRDELIRECNDQRRGLDYLATRPEIDMGKVGCFAFSVGGSRMVESAVESRFRSIYLMGNGVGEEDVPALPEVNAFNFIPRIRVPKMLLNGRYDETVQRRTRGRYLYDALVEPKRLVEVEGGHLPLFERWVPHARAWFDETLGPATREEAAR